MRFGSHETEDQVWIRDQAARILHRYLAGKHFRIDVDALLSRVRRFEPPSRLAYRYEIEPRVARN